MLAGDSVLLKRDKLVPSVFRILRGYIFYPPLVLWSYRYLILLDINIYPNDMYSLANQHMMMKLEYTYRVDSS